MIKGLTLLGVSLIFMVVTWVFSGLYLATSNPVFVVLEGASLVVQLGFLVSGAVIGIKSLLSY